MTRFASVAGRLVVLLTALLGSGCPPSPDLAPATTTAPRRPEPAPDGLSEAAYSNPGETAAPSATPPATESDEPRPAVVSPTAKPTVYEHLAGGVYAARCAACGAVQPEASTQCPSCGQALRPWRQEQLCTLCMGSGACDRCGDDRVCLDCEGLGACAFCAGTGKQGADKCGECGGNGRCVACQGDGRRESTSRDFGPYETLQPGICPTCVDGSGLCPDCGTLTKDRAGGNCLTCAGSGMCFDCGGTGLCAHDAGDGLCLVCGGGGREVKDGTPPKLSARVWSLRSASGTPFVGRVLGRPDPNVHVQLVQNANTAPIGYTRAQLSPLSYYLAARDWTAQNDGKARMDLATIALSSGFWAVAQQEFRRAMAADPALASEAAAQLREVVERRTLHWLDVAEKAKKAGDRDGALVFLNLVHFQARGSPQATRADVITLQIQREREEEEKSLDDASRQRIADEAKARAERAVSGVRMRLDRARHLIAEGQRLQASDPGIDRLLARADAAVHAAQRIVQRGAYRDPSASVAWPVKPELLLNDARHLRAEIAVIHAGREIAGGRFEFGGRLARRAMSLDAADPRPQKLSDEAQMGLARRGVLRASPAPTQK